MYVCTYQQVGNHGQTYMSIMTEVGNVDLIYIPLSLTFYFYILRWQRPVWLRNSLKFHPYVIIKLYFVILHLPSAVQRILLHDSRCLDKFVPSIRVLCKIRSKFCKPFKKIVSFISFDIFWKPKAKCVLFEQTSKVNVVKKQI